MGCVAKTKLTDLYIMRCIIVKPFAPFILVLLVFCRCRDAQTEVSAPNEGSALFTLLAPEKTGISFQNTLTEGPNTNILMYEYFYNGGGVAAGDFNGDDLPDLYFTANMTDNRLYLNQGNLQFRDITRESGAGGHPGPWKTGVSVADINGDRRLDIYVSYSGMLPEPKRANQLFINLGNDANGIPHFEDRAAAYGLASPGFSNQTYFFDYDRDGDLDMLLLNHNPKSLPVLNEIQNAEMIRQDDPLQGVRLFRQDQQQFTDVTKNAGIRGSGLTYGLGLGISDVNRDGWPDFYISNDYAVPDYLYINNKNGTFTDQLDRCMGHNSQFSMGNDVADINNDQWPDVVTLDMLPEDNRRQKLLIGADNYSKFDLNVRSGFHYQYMRNMLQLNNGNGTFSEIGQLAGISNTDWSWAALLADYDNDGWKDLFVTNGYLRDYTNLDFINFMDSFVKSRGRLKREDVLELVSHMPASNVVNYVFANQGGASFTNKTREWGLQRPSNSNGAVYADLDNDGDLDLVVNNINQPAFVYRNDAREKTGGHFLRIKLQGTDQNTQGIGAVVTVQTPGKKQTLEQYCSRGYLSAVSSVLHFGLGAAAQADTLHIVWPDGREQILTAVAADKTIVLDAKDAVKPVRKSQNATPIFRELSTSPVAVRQPALEIRDFNRQNLLLTGMSYIGPCMAKGDVNGDGREDVVAGGIAGQGLSLFLQQTGTRFSKKIVPAFETDNRYNDADLALFDANGDGHLDLYAASGGYHQLQEQDSLLQDRLYLNDGKGNFTKAIGALPDVRASKGCVAAGDCNGDGFIDLYVGGRVIPGRYPEAPPGFLLLNDGKGHFKDETERLAPALRRLGMVTDAVWVDLDSDKQMELAIVGEWLPVSIFGMKSGKMEDLSPQWVKGNYNGWYNTLAVADLNADQKPDLVVGNMGLNTQFRASEKEPATLYYRDFDGNGSVDPFFCFYIQGKNYPYVTRDELGQQLPRMKARFNSYESYADITLEELFPESELKQARHWTATHMETGILLNQGAMLQWQSLPAQAQYAPVYAIEALDANQDGHTDLLLCGNNNHFKLRLGKFDANYGVLLTGDGKGNFQYVPQLQSGLQLRGDVRSILTLGNICLFGINQGALSAYQFKKKS